MISQFQKLHMVPRFHRYVAVVGHSYIYIELTSDAERVALAAVEMAIVTASWFLQYQL